MPFEKVPDVKPSEKGPISLPEEISPTVYLQQFVEWLQTSKTDTAGNIHIVQLRLVWLYASSLEENGVVTYGEIGMEEGHNHLHTLSLGMTPDRGPFLKGTIATYRSNDRWGDKAANENSLSGAKIKPFDPEKTRLLNITIWADTGEVILQSRDIKSPGQKWAIFPQYATASNLLYGTPAGIAPPLPMVMLSLAQRLVPVGA
jgi:hypothetical protein